MISMIELLSPAGTLEKLKYALLYGADAVYLAGEKFGLRAQAGNFTLAEIAEGLKIVRFKGKKLYVTINSYLYDDEYKELKEYLLDLKDIGPDALIISDLGVLETVKEVWPKAEIHISTQANTTSLKAAKVWQKLGASRIILAREVNLARIKEMAKEMETEIFVHGAMCMAYSGRCILSAYLTGRSANKGDCTHTCRWKYYLVEEQRQGQYMPIEEDERGSYILSPGDLCLLGDLPDLIQAGVKAFKIEGRMKSVHYVAATTLAYRLALDALARGEMIPKLSYDLVESVSHRPFSKGFLYGRPSESYQSSHSYLSTRDFVAVIEEDHIAVRTVINTGETLEILTPKGEIYNIIWPEMYKDGQKVLVAHPNWQVKVDMPVLVPKMSLVRRVQAQ